MATDTNIAYSKLQQIIDNGRTKLAGGMEAMAKEYGLRRDYIAKVDAVDVEVVSSVPQDAQDVTPGPQRIRLRVQDQAFDLTGHARSQLLQRAQVPQTFADNLLDRGLGELLRHNLRTLMPVVSNEGLMVRTVQEQAKAVLSPRYRRMDSSPLFELYLSHSLQRAGMVPYAGQVTDTRAFAATLWPEVVDLGAGEYVALGTELRNSDYGNGAFALNMMVVRLLCVNGMVGMDVLRKVHLGKRFEAGVDDGAVIDISTRTHMLDTATVRSGLNDVLGSMNAQREALVASLRERVNAKVSLRDAVSKLQKRGLRKDVLEKVTAMYEQPLPVEALPQEPGAWRLSNVLSLIANGTTDGDVAKDLQGAAWELMLPAKAA